MTKTHVRIFWHTLKLKAKDAQLVDYPWHTVGHHTQIFCANQHSCSIDKLRKLSHCLAIPEMVIASVEVIVVELIEDLLVAIVETLIDKVELNRYARMKL